LIVRQCGQLQALRDKRGNIAEPLWYAVLGVLVFCEDGVDLGHKWSKGYPGYTYEETQARLDRARRLKGATTCKHFYSLNPQVCEACAHWQKINSPIALGDQDNRPIKAPKFCPSGAPPPPSWELTAVGALKPKSYINTAIALRQLGIGFKHDIFAGLQRTEIEKVKSFVSRTEDSARPAYGRFRIDQRRGCVFVGTTNEN
jgi:hypothetical protein